MKAVKKWPNLLLLSVAIAIVVCPLVLLKNASFGGTDDTAKETIKKVAPNYQPWFHSLFVPPGTTESLLFAVQAGIGAGGIGYAIGFYRGRSLQRSRQEEKKP